MRRILGLAFALSITACDKSIDPIAPLTVPQAPTNVAVTQVSAALRLTWVDNSTNEEFFRIELSTNGGSWSEFGQAAANATSTSVSAPLPATRYAFRVSACNLAGCSPTGEAAIVTPEATAPASLSISLIAKTAADAVQINVQLPGKLTGSITLKLRRAGDSVVLLSRTQEWTPNLPLTVDFYFSGLDPSVTYEVEATLSANGSTSIAPTRTFRLSDM